MTVVTQLTPNIGAEITEIDLRHPIDTNTANWLKGQLVKHKVIFFRDQAIDSQEHLNFAQLFGDLETHPVNPKEGFSEILVLHNHADNPPSDTAVWHSDVTWRNKPSLGSILVARKVPTLGGDTLFANMELAYDGLDDQTKNLIQNHIDNNEVCLFMKGTPEVPQCGFSLAVSNVLKHLNVKFTGINVLEDPKIREGIKIYSDWPTIPQLYIKGEFVGGCDIVKEMFEKGDLQKKLKEKSISYKEN
mgnify:CR=1 FL=1